MRNTQVVRVSTLKSCYSGVSIWSSLHQGSLSLESPSFRVSPSGDVPPRRFPFGESPFWKSLLLETPILGVHIWRVSILESLHPGDPNLKIFHLRASIWGIPRKAPSQCVHWGVFILAESAPWGFSIPRQGTLPVWWPIKGPVFLGEPIGQRPSSGQVSVKGVNAKALKMGGQITLTCSSSAHSILWWHHPQCYSGPHCVP